MSAEVSHEMQNEWLKEIFLSGEMGFQCVTNFANIISIRDIGYRFQAPPHERQLNLPSFSVKSC